MDLGVSGKVAPILESVRNFINDEVLPLEEEYKAQIEIGSPGNLPIARLKFLRA